MWILEKGCLADTLNGYLLIKCKTDIEIRSVPVVSVCHRMGTTLAQLWPPGFDPWWPVVFVVRVCTVHFRSTAMSILRDHTYISLERADTLTTIKDLLWQAGLRQASSKPPKNIKLAPPLSTSWAVGLFFWSSEVLISSSRRGLEHERKNRDFSADCYVWVYVFCGHKTSIIYVQKNSEQGIDSHPPHGCFSEVTTSKTKIIF